MGESVAHILLVEDSEDDALLLQGELAKMARRVDLVRVDSRAQMRAALAARRWDLVISDHMMPAFDSGQAYEELRRSGQDAPLIILSGTLAEDLAANAMLTGASDFIDKGHRARLIPVIERELRNASIRRAKDDVERALVHMTYHDTLTGLPNRSMLERLVEQHVANDPNVRSAVLVLDIDRFLRVNESLGYAGGNGVLKEIAARLAKVAGDHAVVTRLGEDNFAVYYDHVDHSQMAVGLANQLTAALADPFESGSQPLFISGSVGVCLFPDGATGAAELIGNAEHAQFDAREKGPGSVHVFARDHASARFGDPLHFESALRQAIERHELFLMYQPLIALDSGALTGVEALVRWRHPQYGVVGPGEFIPLAEKTGLIVELGQWVLDTACAQVAAWQCNELPGLTLAVNVSALQFRTEGFVARLAATLAATGLNPASLELELIESSLMEDIDASIDKLRAIKRMGTRLSIDDFGTGYSSLSYLSRLPLDVLKIDRSFLHNIENEIDKRAIATTIVALAKGLHLSIVAEGVETPGQLQFVRGLRCERAQGYLIARPLDVDAVPAFRPARLSDEPDLPPVAAPH